MVNLKILTQRYRKKLLSWIRLLEGETGILYFNWLIRTAILIALVLYFVYRKSEFEPLELGTIKLSLLIFFIYNIITGFFGVLHPEWFLHDGIKIIQFCLEISMYSLFYSLSNEIHADIFFFYFAPLFFAVYFLNFFQALIIIAFTGLNLYVVINVILQLQLSQGILNSAANSLTPNFWPRFILLIAMSLAYAIRRRTSLHRELRDEGTTFSGFFQSLDDGVFIIDDRHNLVYVNEALQVHHGSFQVGKPANDYFRCNERLFSCEPLQNVQPAGAHAPRINSGIFVDLEGVEYQVEISLIPLSEGTGRSGGTLGIVKDKDRSLRLEKDLKGQIYRYGERVKSLVSQRALWQDTYMELGKRLIGFDDPQALMNFVVAETRSRLKAETSSLFLVEGATLYRKAIAGVQPDWHQEECYKLGDGITGQVIQAEPDSKYGQVVRHNKVNQDPKVVTKYLEAYQAQLKTHQVRHLMAVPLNGKDSSFGVLRVVNKIDESGNISKDGFNEEDEGFLVTISAMVAISLENSRLYKQEQDRRIFSDTVLEVSGKINTNLERRKILPDIIDELDKVIPNTSISIQAIEGNEIRIVACKGFEKRDKVIRLKFPLDEPKYPNSIVIKTKAPFRVDDVHQSFRHFLEEADKFSSAHIRSWMGIPLIYRDSVIGMISFDHQKPGFYTQDLESMALMFANQIAIAIANAQLFQEQKLQMENLDSLLQVSQVVASSIALDDVLHKIVETANQVSGSDLTGVLLIDDKGELSQSYESNPIGYPLYLRARPEGVTNQVIKSRKPVFFNHIKPNDKKHNPVVLQAGFHAYGGLPIVSSGKIVGVLFVHSYKANRYNRRKIIPLLETLCNQAAVAVENALLYKKLANQAHMLKGLVDASSGLIQHTSLDELLKYCAYNAAKIFDVEDCSLFLRNVERNTIDLVYSTAIPPEVWDKRVTKIDDPGLTAYVARQGEILNFGGDEYKNHPAWAGHFGPPYLDNLMYLPSKHSHSLLICPIQDSHGNIVGVLKLENRKGLGKNHRFGEFEIDMQKTFGSHIGTAVERARLYEQLDKEARREAREALSYDIHDISNMIHGALIMRLEVAREKLARDMFSDVGFELSNIAKAAQAVHSLLRWIHYDLRGDNMLHEKGLIAALEHIASLYKIQYETQVIGRNALPVDIEYSLYKIGLEALVNSAKHGGDKVRVFIRLTKDNASFNFEIQDNGYGFDKTRIMQRPFTFGLNSMQRWAESMGADIDFNSKPNSGTTIVVTGKIPQKEIKNG